MKRFIHICVLNCFLILSNLYGQTVSPSPSVQPTPPIEDKDIIKITTNLVQVDATVTDKEGKIVTGLTAEDFDIYENDKKQQITNFSFIRIQSDSISGNKTLASPKNSPLIPAIPISRTQQVNRTIALVVDDLSLSLPNINPVKQALKKFVDEQMQPGDMAAVIRTGSSIGTLQQFTSDKRLLRAAIERIRWSIGSGGPTVFPPIDPSDLGAMLNSSISSATPVGINDLMENLKAASENRADLFAAGSLGTLDYIVKGMRELPGRKAIALFSEGFGIYDSGKPNARLIRGVERLVESANRYSINIYTMDARGVVNPMLLAEENVQEFKEKVDKTAAEKFIEQRSKSVFESQQGLRTIAEQTGGFLVLNDLNKGLERVLSDQNGYYLLAYQPDEQTFNPNQIGSNKITVKLKRPDLKIRYRRTGFQANDKEESPQLTKTPRQQILAALMSPLNSAEIYLRMTALFSSDERTGNFIRSFIHVKGSDLKFSEQPDGSQTASFDVAVMLFGDSGAIVDELNLTQTIRARAETLKEIKEKGFVSTITFPIKNPGAYQMRMVLRDTSTSKTGSANQFVEVPDLKKQRLTLSGILIQRFQEQPSDFSKISEKQPFQTDEERDVSIRSFPVGSFLRFGYAIYNAKLNASSKLPDLTMQFKIFTNGKEIFISKEKSIGNIEKTDSQTFVAEGRFNIGKELAPGDYVLQIIVKDLSIKGKYQIATQWIDFEVTK